MAKVGRLVHEIDNTEFTGTTYDATISGFGDVTAFVTHMSGYDDFYGSGDSTHMSVFGLRDSGGNFDVYSVAFNIRDGIGTSDTHRSWNYTDNNVAYFREVCELEFSPITNGIRIELTGIASSVNDRYMTAYTTAFSGVKAARLLVTGTGQESWTTTSHQDGSSFTPGAVFAHSAGHNVFSGGNETTDIAAYSLGFSTSSTQWSLSYTDNDGSSSQTVSTRLSNSSVLNQVYNNSSQFADSTAYWSSTGLAVNKTLGSRQAIYMAIDDSVQISAGTASSNTSTGTTAYGTATSNDPVVADVFATNVTSTSIFSSNPACGGFMHGHLAESSVSSTGSAVNGFNDYVGGDNVSTMIAEMYNGSNFTRRKYTGSTLGTSWTGTPSFTSGKQLQINYTTVDGTARDFAYIYYAVTPTDTTFIVNVATFSLTGNAASLNITFGMPASTGTFAVSGSAATLSVDTALQATAGSFSVSGAAVGLNIAFNLQASVGAFSLTGPAISTLISTGLEVNVGAFTLTGNDANLQAQISIEFSVNAGAFTVSAPNVFYTLSLGHATGSFAVAGGFTDLVDSASIVKSQFFHLIMMQD